VYPIPEKLLRLEDQPVQFVDEVAGLYFRSILLEKAGFVVPQHVHDYDHASYIGSGAARLWVNGEWIGDYQAGHAIEIKAGKEHVFEALEDNTRIACVHDAKSAESVKSKGV